MQLCFFEDRLLKRFHPLTLTRPQDDLRTGIMTIRQKWENALAPSSIVRILRPELRGVFDAGSIESAASSLWVNSRYLPEQELLKEVRDLSPGSCLKAPQAVIAAHVDAATSAEWQSAGQPDFNSLLVVETGHKAPINYLWDLFLINGKEIAADLNRLGIPGVHNSASVSGHALLEQTDNIFIDEGARVEPGVIIIADEGPVYIGKRATVKVGAILRGPVAICDGAIVNMGARIYDGTTIGPVSKAAGEICNSIFHSYSNKAHEGFTGHSLIGQWCNLGADTNTSNLKNNYSNVEITDWESGDAVDTGRLFTGTIMGDHSKTAINVQLNTGTVCGVSCNILTSAFPPKLIPSFSWVGSNVIQPYQFEKAVETMRAVMQRRNIELKEPYIDMMKQIRDAGQS